MRDIAIIGVVAVAVLAIGYAWSKSRQTGAPSSRLGGTNSADAVLSGRELEARWDPYALRDAIDWNQGW